MYASLQKTDRLFRIFFYSKVVDCMHVYTSKKSMHVDTYELYPMHFPFYYNSNRRHFLFHVIELV
jgi:hypothetical protein